MGLRQLVYRAYERRLADGLTRSALPRHIGVILDGNRRWAKQLGADSSEGHRAGAAKILEFLGWCDEVGVEMVTLWLLSTDNLSGRSADELAVLFGISEDVAGRIAETGRWRVHPVGALDLLPAATAGRLKELEDATRAVGGKHVNIAVGYGGRAGDRGCRAVAAARARRAGHVDRGARRDPGRRAHRRAPVHPRPARSGTGDPHLRRAAVVRFLLWQSAHSEFSFVEALWPDFRKVDFLRALRNYAQRERRYGA